MSILGILKTIVKDIRDIDTKPATCYYYWQKGSESMMVKIEASYADPSHFFGTGEMSVEAYNKAVAVINQGIPTGRPRTFQKLFPYCTLVYLRHGEVDKVVDQYYDLSNWTYETGNLFSQFEAEFNGPPIKSIIRK